MSLISVTMEIASKDRGFATVNEFVIVEFTTVSRQRDIVNIFQTKTRPYLVSMMKR